ncbi:MAG: bifunctional DNA-formamidopyrimidine glycosylase/DNA-(apurinic or apyrimidinic site) lyase [Pseudomonadota bacterium]
MPELPEVETVRRGLAPAMTGAVVTAVDQRRPDLRFPFPDNFAQRLTGATVEAVERRAKFLLFPLSTGETMIAHLGMTGRFSIQSGERTLEPGAFYAPDPPSGHDHLVLDLEDPSGGPVRVVFSDPRRFGFIELLAGGDLVEGRLSGIGPEPLSDAFTAAELVARLKGKATPIKAALLDQKVVAGLGNIYVCEALFRAGISPKRLARTIGAGRADKLVAAIKDVLAEAIDAGGSTLRDYAAANGQQGGFQQRFFVYGRENEPCAKCSRPVKKVVQSGRSTFYCSHCQR